MWLQHSLTVRLLTRPLGRWRLRRIQPGRRSLIHYAPPHGLYNTRITQGPSRPANPPDHRHRPDDHINGIDRKSDGSKSSRIRSSFHENDQSKCNGSDGIPCGSVCPCQAKVVRAQLKEDGVYYAVSSAKNKNKERADPSSRPPKGHPITASVRGRRDHGFSRPSPQDFYYPEDPSRNEQRSSPEVPFSRVRQDRQDVTGRRPESRVPSATASNPLGPNRPPTTVQPQPRPTRQERERAVPVGLYSKGQTCYMHAVLQCIFAVRAWRAVLIDPMTQHVDPGRLPMLHALGTLFRCMLYTRAESVSAESFAQSFRAVQRRQGHAYTFNSDVQHDAEEFSTQLLNRLKEELRDSA